MLLGPTCVYPYVLLRPSGGGVRDRVSVFPEDTSFPFILLGSSKVVGEPVDVRSGTS